MSSGDSFLASRKKKDVGAPLIETGLRASSMPLDAKHYSTTQKADEKVKTARAPASAHLLIDSLDRYKNGYPTALDPPTSSSAWTLQLKSYVLNGYFTRLAVTQVQFQWNLPTIITDYNDEFIVSQGGVLSVATIPPGWYDYVSLAAMITTRLAAATPAPPVAVVTCAYNEQFDAFSLATAGGGLTTIADVPSNILSKRFGITTGLQYGSLGTGTALVIGSVPTMLATRFIDIRSSYLTKNQKVKDFTTLPENIVSDIIARVYAMPPNTTSAGKNVDYGTGTTENIFGRPWIMNISYPVPKYIRWNSAEPISNFSIELLDDGGFPLYDLSTATLCEYSITMIASED